MKKNLFCFLIVLQLIFISCSTNKQADNEASETANEPQVEKFELGDKTFLVTPVSKSDFEKAISLAFDTSEKNNLIKDAPLIKRSGDTLVFSIKDGKTVTLTNNNSDDDNYAQYSYLGRLNAIGQFVVSGSFYEWYNILLINEHTGDTTALSGLPVLSPDKKHLLTANCDLFAGFTFNGFELFEINDKTIKLIGTKEFTGWGPDEIIWINDADILVKRTVIDTATENNERTEFVKLSLQ